MRRNCGGGIHVFLLQTNGHAQIPDRAGLQPSQLCDGNDIVLPVEECPSCLFQLQCPTDVLHFEEVLDELQAFLVCLCQCGPICALDRVHNDDEDARSGVLEQRPEVLIRNCG